MRTKYLATLAIAIGLTIPGMVSAAATTITFPASGSTVGRTFELSGTGTSGAQFGVTVDGKSYVPVAYRNQSGGEYPSGGTIDAQGRFGVTLDLTGNHAVSDGGGYYGVSAGRHIIMVQEFFFNGQSGTPGKTEIAVDVRDSGNGTATGNQAPNHPASTNAAATTVSPGTSPVISPSPVQAAGVATTKGASPAPAWVVLVAAVVGMIVIAVVHRFSPTETRR